MLLSGILIGKKLKCIAILLLLLNPPADAQVLETAQGLTGQHIGDKMCYSYIETVLRQSKHTIDTTCMVDSVQPGDILISYGFYRVEVKPSKYKVLSGVGAHIAIVVKDLGNDCYLVLDQNGAEKKEPVQYRILNFKEYGVIYSYGYCFVRPYPGEYTEATHRLVRGFDGFPVTNYSDL